jgi:hypothetical protein
MRRNITDASAAAIPESIDPAMNSVYLKLARFWLCERDPKLPSTATWVTF